MQRLIAAILAVANIANGLMMLVAGPLWYQNVSGAAETGAAPLGLWRIQPTG